MDKIAITTPDYLSAAESVALPPGKMTSLIHFSASP
ncbi:hypothetical protein KPNJ1_04347 [Klebsiella pneumoniae 30660/NJST258_1]|uniref:Uncharacterized protein n=1 Tax=Klebsiella pneumoniae 30684/NJST258_2 TaxID=1420013 RepID=W8UZJ9_KLEPN|nr:hypothetical protein KPNJ2_04298 [Klebsiella pneumoniae 30684/NJST258_2]AHM86753.1 hypothetical protein KPNJ1_04347 [Klebsiella pneumoniae 30660/NJST258_1]